MLAEVEKAFVENAAQMATVLERLSVAEILAQLGEESAELTQAALKLRRVLDGTNYTPVTEADAYANLQEEIADVLFCLMLIGMNEERISEVIRRKAGRWVKRLETGKNFSENC